MAGPVEGVFGDLRRQDMSIHIDPKEASLAKDEPYILPQVGFWLPDGMQMKDFVGPWMNRYNELKSIYLQGHDRQWLTWWSRHGKSDGTTACH